MSKQTLQSLLRWAKRKGLYIIYNGSSWYVEEPQDGGSGYLGNTLYQALLKAKKELK